MAARFGNHDKWITSEIKLKYVRGNLMDSARNFTNGLAVSDNEGLETSNLIIGLCPDMCPGILGF